MIATYSQLLTELMRLIDGDEAANVGDSVASLQQAIGFAERRIYRELRTRYNEKSFTALTTTGNLATIPADFEALSVVYTDGKPLQPVSEEWLRTYLDDHPGGTTARYVACAGPSLMFGSALADGTAVNGRYFVRLPALSTATLPTNPLFAVAEDLFLYAAAIEAGPMFQKQEEMQAWGIKYQSLRDSINENARSSVYSAGRIIRRPSAQVLR